MPGGPHEELRFGAGRGRVESRAETAAIGYLGIAPG